MNPVAVVLILVAVVMIIVGYKGKQDTLISAIKDKRYGNTGLT